MIIEQLTKIKILWVKINIKKVNVLLLGKVKTVEILLKIQILMLSQNYDTKSILWLKNHDYELVSE